MYELTSLRTPFDAQNAVTLAVKINTANVPRIPYRYSEELDRVIQRYVNLLPYFFFSECGRLT